MRRLRALARSQGDRGLTLIELLVAMSLLSIVMTLVTMLVINLSQTFTREQQEQDSANLASVGMQAVTRTVRAATELPTNTWQPTPAFDVATPSSMTLNTYLDPDTAGVGPTRVTLVVNSTTRELVETRFDSYRSGGRWLYSATPSSTRVVVRDIAPAGSPLQGGTSPALFTYLAATGAPIAVGPGGALTEAQRRDVVAVRISIVVQTDTTGRADAAQVVSTVSLPNLGSTRVEQRP